MRNRVIPQTGVHNGPHVSFWIRELPFSPVLILTLLGVAHTSFLKLSIMGYWELLAPVIGLVCIGSGWSSANDKSARLQLYAGAVLGCIPARDEYPEDLNVSATGLAVLMLLALGTFTAGVHVLSWRVCLLGSSWRSAFRRWHGSKLPL
jgi:hypothetical protein